MKYDKNLLTNKYKMVWIYKKANQTLNPIWEHTQEQQVSNKIKIKRIGVLKA